MLKSSALLSRNTQLIFHLPRTSHSVKVTTGLRLNFHRTSSSRGDFEEYPNAGDLSLPSNIENVATNENSKFSPERSRDISGSFISFANSPNCSKVSMTSPDGAMIECYDCSGAINLSSSMQTSVPHPFASGGKPTHLNMPGGHWSQKEKYVSEDLNKVHHANSRDLNSKNVGVSLSLGVKTGSKNMYVGLAGKCLDPLYPDVSLAVKPNQFNSYCTDKKNDANESIKSVSQTAQLSRKEKFKMAIKDYGIVILVFHIGVSLISLGCCYVAIASGAAQSSLFQSWGLAEGAATAGTAAVFVVAYAVHKAMAPWRIGLTLTVVPFAVKKLRAKGYLKTSKPKATAN